MTNSWSGRDVLNIPGLMPVNIGSSSPYPVPNFGRVQPPITPWGAVPQSGGAGGDFTAGGFGGGLSPAEIRSMFPHANVTQPQIDDILTQLGVPSSASSLPLIPVAKPVAKPVPQPTVSGSESGLSIDASGTPSQAYAPLNIASAPPPQQHGVIPTVSTQEGDQLQPQPQSMPSFDNSQWTGQISAPNNSFGGLSQSDLASLSQLPSLAGLDPSALSKFFDGLTATPSAPTAGQYGQLAVNALGLTPLGLPASILDAIGLGTNTIPTPDRNDNSAVNMATQPGAMTNFLAKNIVNPISQLFGGNPMGMVSPTAMGPTANGDPWGGWNPEVAKSLGINQADIANASAPGAPSSGGGYQSSYPDSSSFGNTGNLLDTFMQGAGFGGASYGYGGNDPIYSPTSWAAPGFGATDRGMNPYDTN